MDKLRRMRAEQGFTLNELLVVIAIIGILAAIAIPQFAAYRRRAYESDVKSNLKNAATAQEAYFVDTDAYLGAGCCSNDAPPGYNISTNVTMTAATTAQSFVLTGSHSSCAGATWTYTSDSGQILGGPCN